MVTPIIYDFVADLRHDNKFIVGKVPQGDIGTRRLSITVTDNGEPYDLPTSGVLYICNGTNGAGGVVYITCSIETINEKKTIRIDLPDSMVNFSGIGKYRISIVDSTNEDIVLSSFTFSIAVEKDPTVITDITGTDDYSALQELISAASGFNKWITGTVEPNSSIGNTLDLYLNTTNGRVYQKGQTDWVYKCTFGSTIYLAYATSSTGANFSTTYTGTETWLGICTTQSETQPTTPSSYTWVLFSGGDNMKISNYGGSDDHTVSQADALKGEVILKDIGIPSNTSTDTTTVTVTNDGIATSSIIEGIYTTMPGLNYLSVSITNHTLTIVFPATSTSATAMVKLLNVGNYIYPDPSNWNDVIPVAETVDIDFSNFDNRLSV